MSCVMRSEARVKFRADGPISMWIVARRCPKTLSYLNGHYTRQRVWMRRAWTPTRGSRWHAVYTSLAANCCRALARSAPCMQKSLLLLPCTLRAIQRTGAACDCRQTRMYRRAAPATPARRRSRHTRTTHMPRGAAPAQRRLSSTAASEHLSAIRKTARPKTAAACINTQPHAGSNSPAPACPRLQCGAHTAQCMHAHTRMCWLQARQFACHRDTNRQAADTCTEAHTGKKHRGGATWQCTHTRTRGRSTCHTLKHTHTHTHQVRGHAAQGEGSAVLTQEKWRANSRRT